MISPSFPTEIKVKIFTPATKRSKPTTIHINVDPTLCLIFGLSFFFCIFLFVFIFMVFVKMIIFSCFFDET